MTIWKKIQGGFLVAGAFLFIAGFPVLETAQAQVKQDGPPVVSAPRTGVQTATPEPSAGTPAESTTPMTTVEVAMDTSVAIVVKGYSETIVSQETIADIKIDPRHPEKIRIFGRSIGSTNIFFLNRNGDMVHRLEVHVTLDSGGVKYALSKLIPDEAIEVSTYRDTIFLSGRVRTTAAAQQAMEIARRFVKADDNIKNMMTVTGSQQVIIQVRVAEMERSVRKELSAGLTNTRVGGAVFSTANTLLTSPVSNFNFLNGTLGDANITALEGKNLARTLAEPTLTAISGETASFLSGGEIPYIAKIDQNNNATYEYKEYGIGLEFTPVVLDEGRISMDITLEVSALDKPNYVNNVPALKTKKTDTNINLPSGGTLMISGLTQDDGTNQIAGVPFLKDIPILGALFRATDFDRTEKELVVIVTAYLASPTDASAPLSMPTDGFESASDMDIYLLGKLQRSYGKSKEPIWTDPLVGPYGYIMK